jgi:uncharacterized protein HemY
MGTVVGVLVVLFVVLFVVSKCVNSISKSGQKMRGRNRCAECKSRLKAVNGKYATRCRRCGATQPWAEVASPA